MSPQLCGERRALMRLFLKVPGASIPFLEELSDYHISVASALKADGARMAWCGQQSPQGARSSVLLPIGGAGAAWSRAYFYCA